MLLIKIVRVSNVQVCMLKNDLVYFRLLDSGVWEQAQAVDNMLVYTIPYDRPLVHFADDWLNSDSLTVKLKRLKRGIYTPK